LKKVKWNRSEDGFVNSKCGDYRIVPKWWGRVQPQEFVLEFMGKRICSRDTQREAKEQAQIHAQFLEEESTIPEDNTEHSGEDR
jgi:hypothetical protein